MKLLQLFSIPAAVGLGLAILALAVLWVRSQCFPISSGEAKWQCGASPWLVALAYFAASFTAAFLARQRKVAVAIFSTALVFPVHAFLPFFGIVFFSARWQAVDSLVLFVALPAVAGSLGGVWASRR
jgi:hypothetical protein